MCSCHHHFAKLFESSLLIYVIDDNCIGVFRTLREMDSLSDVDGEE